MHPASDPPRSLIAFARRFPDERSCAAFLAELRWPGGFRCETVWRLLHKVRDALAEDPASFPLAGV